MNGMTDVSIPSLSSSAMLVDLSISIPTMRKRDRKVTKSVAEQNNAEARDLNTTKDILGGCVQLSELQNWAMREVRARTHYASTLPWSDMGSRIVTCANFPDYWHAMSLCEQEFWERAQSVWDVYEWEIIQAETRLGDMFDESLYPPLDSFKAKFKFKVTAMPLPDAGDFRVDLPAEAVQILKDEYDKHYNDSVGGAMRALMWGTDGKTGTFGLLRQLLNQLNDGVIYSGTVDRVYELLTTLRTCNLTNDPQIEAARVKLEEQFRGVGRLPISKEALREDIHLRTETQTVLEDVINTLPTIDL